MPESIKSTDEGSGSIGPLSRGIPAISAPVTASRVASNTPAYIAFIVLGLIWGSNFIFAKWALSYLTATQVVFLRVLFGFIPIFVAALLTKSLSWHHWRHVHHFLVMSVFATAIFYIAYAKGTALLLSSVAGMLSGAAPLFTFVTALIFLRDEPINILTASGILLGFLGVILIARPWSHGFDMNVTGVLWMIGGSFSLGAAFVYTRKFISPLGLSPLALTTYQMGIALVLLLLAADLTGLGRVFSDVRASLGLIGGLGLCGTGLAYTAYYFIVDRLGAVAASSVTYIPPVVALAIGALFVGEPVGLLDLVAMAAILGGVAILQSGQKF
jgi:drug/metabolite transporter (DMT)-like permease